MANVIRFKNNNYLFGTIFEKGQNENGNYIKFTDGTLIQWNTITVTDQAINSVYGNLYQGTRIITFPIPFINGYYSAHCSQFQYGTAATWGAVVNRDTNSTMTIRGFDAYSRASGARTSISWFAIGYWK